MPYVARFAPPRRSRSVTAACLAQLRRRSFVLCRLLREVLKRRAFAAGDSVPNVVGPVARTDVFQAWGIGMGALKRAVPLLHVV